MNALTASPAGRRAYTRGVLAMRSFGLLALLATTVPVHPRPGPHGRGLAVAVLLAVTAAGWVWMTVAGVRRWRLEPAVTLLGVAGGALAAVQPGPSITMPAVAALAAGTNLAPVGAIAVAVASAVAVAVAGLLVGLPAVADVGFSAILASALGMGMLIRINLQRADAAEQLLEQTQRAARAEAQAAVLGERTRIAREIHDILAHSLGALAMQVEAAQALLTREEPDVAKALRCVERAGQLTREGLVESRRAVQALREDISSLAEAIGALVAGEGGEMAVAGEERRLAPEAALALYRTAQEAVTNARKHAPGSAVEVSLRYGVDEVRLTVVNQLAAADAARPLTDSGGGFGLSGLRERAELAGGTLTAGRDGDRWRVEVVIPAAAD